MNLRLLAVLAITCVLSSCCAVPQPFVIQQDGIELPVDERYGKGSHNYVIANEQLTIKLSSYVVLITGQKKIRSWSIHVEAINNADSEIEMATDNIEILGSTLSFKYKGKETTINQYTRESFQMDKVPSPVIYSIAQGESLHIEHKLILRDVTVDDLDNLKGMFRLKNIWVNGKEFVSGKYHFFQPKHR
ncbi:MAG: hypothetical protein H3C54_11330 [Taibaiella sp.]|nr:hypothetical protein [Taibaiella sp.]